MGSAVVRLLWRALVIAVFVLVAPRRAWRVVCEVWAGYRRDGAGMQ